MLDVFRRCLQVDILGFCSKKGSVKYVDFGAGGKGKNEVDASMQDMEWDADIDALTEMEYNIVAEQPRKIKLELQEGESYPKLQDSDTIHDEQNTKLENGKTDGSTMDIENHNELSDLIRDEKAEQQLTG